MAAIVLKPILIMLRTLLSVYEIILIARIILSWFVRDYYSNPILNFIYSVTEPLLSRVRNTFRFLVIGFLDLSVIVVFVLINIAQELINYILMRLYLGF